MKKKWFKVGQEVYVTPNEPRAVCGAGDACWIGPIVAVLKAFKGPAHYRVGNAPKGCENVWLKAHELMAREDCK